MYKQIHLTICIFIFFYFQQVVQTYQIYQLDPESRNELIPKLKEILEEQKNEAPEIKKIHVSKEKKKRNRFKPIGKSVFVKRIIPHGYKGGEYEYDARLNTVFKPLVRYHVKKPIDQHERTIVKEMESDYNLKNRFDDGLIVLVKKDRRDPQELLRQIQIFLKKNSRQHIQKKRWNKKRFRGLMSRLGEDDAQLLRIHHKSGEVHDPYAPGKFPLSLAPEDPTPEEPRQKFILPKYPFYNYWTYQKNIIQDICPGNLIQMGNMCVSVTGHRKSGIPIKDAIKSSKPRRIMLQK